MNLEGRAMHDTTDEKFIETIGLIWQAEGNPRIAGQILACLILSDDPRSLSEIAETLGVSKASVSTNVRMLEARGLTEKVSRVGQRIDLWKAVPHPQGATLRAMSQRFRRNADRITEIAHDFGPEARGKQDKVAQFGDFYRSSADFLEQWADQLDKAAPARTTAPHIEDETENHG
jgi:DNA-binding transcriptional regulator GbsR (MarR family)